MLVVCPECSVPKQHSSINKYAVDEADVFKGK